MSIQLQFRRGNTAQTAVFTGAVAEVSVDTDKNTLILHDGVTAGGYALARESSLSANQAFAQQAYNKANAAYDAANTKYSSSGGTIAGNVIVTGNVTPTTDNVYSLGSATYRWKDIFVGAGTVDIDGVKLSKTNNQLVISGATDLVLSDTNLPSSSSTANNIANVFNQANLAFDAANTAYTAGGARAFDQANLAFDKANSAWDYANSAYATANNEILTRQANVGAAVITITGAYEANVGAAVITITGAYEANAGNGDILVTNAYQANVGAARIADQASAQANTGAGLISLSTSITSAYQANVGAGLISNKLDSDANVGAAVISITSAYQANVGEAKIISLGRADSAFAQANLAYDAANNVAPQIQPTRDVANSAFAQANLAFNKANTGFDVATSSFAQANLAYNRANSAWDHANNAYGHANTKLNSSGGTISGDLVISGNLNVTGNVTTYSSQELIINDPIILLANNNNGNVIDIGFTAHYNDGSGNTKHTGLIKDVSSNLWYLFDNYVPHIQETNIIDPSEATFRVANLTANLITNVITLRGLDPLDYANTIQTASQANVGAAVISITNAYQANVGAARIADQATSQANVGSAIAQGQANVGSAVISVTNAYQANVGAGLIANKLASDINVGSAVISVTNAYQANVGAARIADQASAQANTGAGLISLNTSLTNAYQANVGTGLIANKLASDANVGAGLITVTNAYQANVGAGLITKVAKAGDTMTGTLSTSGSLIGSSLTSNNIVTVNTHSVYEATAVTTGSTAQFTLDSFSTSTYRSAKYLVQVTSGSSYELLEMTLIHDGTTVYLSQYGNIKTGATLAVFDATISAGTLSLLATPNNAVTTFKTAATLIAT
jgi:hypothetical protein